jgi:hypothetical protein
MRGGADGGGARTGATVAPVGSRRVAGGGACGGEGGRSAEKRLMKRVLHQGAGPSLRRVGPVSRVKGRQRPPRAAALDTGPTLGAAAVPGLVRA